MGDASNRSRTGTFNQQFAPTRTYRLYTTCSDVNVCRGRDLVTTTTRNNDAMCRFMDVACTSAVATSRTRNRQNTNMPACNIACVVHWPVLALLLHLQQPQIVIVLNSSLSVTSVSASGALVRCTTRQNFGCMHCVVFRVSALHAALKKCMY